MDADTPIEDVIKSRPRTINLAKEVFGHTTMATVRAFSQFKSNAHLAKLITAKREGKFDYGVVIRDTDSGASWPGAAAVIKALSEIENVGELSQESVDALGIADKDELAKLLMQAPAADDKAAKKKAAAAKRKATIARKKKEKAEAERLAAEEAAAAAEAQASSPDPDPDPDDEQGGNHADAEQGAALGLVLERIDQLSNDLADSFQKVVDFTSDKVDAATGKNAEAIQLLDEKVTTTLGVLSLVGKMIEALNANVETLGQYIDPHLELPLVIDGFDDEAGTPTLALVKDEEEEEPEVEVSADEEEEEPEVEEPPGDDDGEIVTYTDEQLQGKSLEELVKLAESVGIADAHKVAYRGVLIRKIKKAQA
jgi:hypothetical protein